MHIKIDSDFDSEFEEIYKGLDDENIIGNGELSNKDTTIIEVDTSDIKSVELDKSEECQERMHSYSECIKNKANSKESIDKDKSIDDAVLKRKSAINGSIVVFSKMLDVNGTLISDAKINLYILNGLSPRLVCTKYTNEDGKVVFNNLRQGSYRVIEIVNRKYFEKPTYVPWNEVTINNELNNETIIVINKMKK